jgi:exodeoxyribonuclease VII small subunit
VIEIRKNFYYEKKTSLTDLSKVCRRKRVGFKMDKKSQPNFEKKLETLESIVKDIETGKLDLDESLKKFEEGITLYKDLKKQISSAEKKIKILTDELKEEDF